MEFKKFLVETVKDIPEILLWVRSFFQNRMDPQVLMVYADWLDDNEQQKAAELFRKIGESWKSPILKRTGWKGQLIGLFYNVMGYYGAREFDINDRMSNSWYIVEFSWNQMRRHIVHSEVTSYRLSLTNGQWFSYTNTGNDRVSVVSTKHVATPESEQYYPKKRITLKDYKPISVNYVPNDLLLAVFYKLLENQVRGGH